MDVKCHKFWVYLTSILDIYWQPVPSETASSNHKTAKQLSLCECKKCDSFIINTCTHSIECVVIVTYTRTTISKIDKHPTK